MKYVAFFACVLLLGVVAKAEDSTETKVTVQSLASQKAHVDRTKDKDGNVVVLHYDDRGNLRAKDINPGTAKEQTWRYGYNAAGQLTSECDPNGRRTLYEYPDEKSKTPKRAMTVDDDGKWVEKKLPPNT